MKSLQLKFGLFDQLEVVRRAQELLRLCNLHFDAPSFGMGEICKSVLCFELACGELQISLHRQNAVYISSMSEKAYVRSLTAMRNTLGLRL
ncbi:origin of replication complex subunit 6 isoform X3 [Physcomitrium patens]|uniref:origin of replication complex subunit 6 isoform X3 n=1 Tax=Physcomitrium patens TaxID=3218 RepID=UPI003CCD2264